MSKQISFEEIRKGDRVRSTNEAGTVLEGVVYHRFKCCWRDKGGYTVACSERMNTHDLELIDRPKPPLPTTPGTVIRATELYGEPCDVLVFVRQSAAADSAVFYVSATPVNGFIEHYPIDITTWEPIEAAQ